MNHVSTIQPGTEQPDFTYPEYGQPTQPATYNRDSFVGDTGEVEVIPRLGTDPEDRMVMGPNGQLKNLGSAPEQPAPGVRFDAPTGNFVPQPRSGEHDNDSAGAAAAFVTEHAIGRSRGTTYRSRSAIGAHRRR